MHEGSKTCLFGYARYSRDRRDVVSDDVVTNSTEQGGARLRSLTRESLTSTVEMPTHSPRDCLPDAIVFQDRDSVLIGGGVWDRRPRSNGAEIVTQHIG
jgi:hypothetical protein